MTYQYILDPPTSRFFLGPPCSLCPVLNAIQTRHDSTVDTRHDPHRAAALGHRTDLAVVCRTSPEPETFGRPKVGRFSTPVPWARRMRNAPYTEWHFKAGAQGRRPNTAPQKRYNDLSIFFGYREFVMTAFHISRNAFRPFSAVKVLYRVRSIEPLSLRS